MSNGWHGVDLDSTLAEWHMGEHTQDGWLERVGKPIPLMVDRVRAWLVAGEEVRIVTARVAKDRIGIVDTAYARKFIDAWCLEQFGQVLPITTEKDLYMIDLYDDRAKQVVPNTGILVEDQLADALREIDYLQDQLSELRGAIELADQVLAERAP